MLAILAAVLLATAPQYDTVFTADGGRFLGTVVEEGPQGVSVQLPDGTTRRLERKDVVRIEYRDGSVSTPNRPAPPPPAYAPQPAPPAYQPPPPAYAPPPAYGPPPTYRPQPPVRREPPPVYADPRGGMPPIFPLYGAFGIGGAFMSGEVSDGVDTDRVFGPQLDIFLEGGLRLNPHVALGLYVDVGVGDPATEVKNAYPSCDLSGNACTATTGRVGVLLRHTFQPRAYSTPWISVGTGFEWGSVSLHDDMGGGNDELFSYTGWEALRLMLGVDLRTNPVFGIGLYGGVGVGRYSRFEDAAGEVDLGREPFHTTVEAGLRFTLFP
jgi:hypothetical protein